MEEVQPRSKLSIWLFGLILGPVVLMLWLGRGWLALIYLLAQPILAGLGCLAVTKGHIALSPFVGLDNISILSILPLSAIGIVHGLKIRKVSVQRPWFSRWYAVILLPLAAILLAAFIIRLFFFQPFRAPSGNMIPSLMIGDYFFVSKVAYGEPRRGDIVAFEHPRDRFTYIMRIVGLPNDRIWLSEGIVTLNGDPLALTRVEGIPCLEGERCNFFRETLPDGRSYVINNAEAIGQADNIDEHVVPAGHYFMLGDNRDNSLDSRFLQIGDIPRENLIDPVILIFRNGYGFRIDDRLEGYPTK